MANKRSSLTVAPCDAGAPAKKQRTDKKRVSTQPAERPPLKPEVQEFCKQFKAPEDSIQWLLANAGVPMAEFFEKFWEKTHLKMAAPAENDTLKKFFGKDWFAEIVRKSVETSNSMDELIDRRDFTVERFVNEKAEELVKDALKPLNLEMFEKALEDKYSVQVMQPERYQAALHAFMEPLESYFGSLVSARGFITPAGAQFRGARYDNAERFVVQTEGAQTWRLYEAKTKFALEYSDDLKAADLAGKEPLEVVTMKPGDVLYIPRGVIAQTEAAADALSSYLVFSACEDNSTYSYLSETIELVLENYRDKCDALRRRLPIGFLTNGCNLSNQKLADTFAALAETVRAENNTLPVAEMLTTRFMTKRLPPFGEPINLNNEEPPTLESKVQLRSKPHIAYFVRQANTDDDANDEEAVDEDEEYELQDESMCEDEDEADNNKNKDNKKPKRKSGGSGDAKKKDETKKDEAKKDEEKQDEEKKDEEKKKNEEKKDEKKKDEAKKDDEMQTAASSSAASKKDEKKKSTDDAKNETSDDAAVVDAADEDDDDEVLEQTRAELVIITSTLNNLESHCRIESSMTTPDFVDAAFSIDPVYKPVLEKLFEAEGPVAVADLQQNKDAVDADGKPIDVVMFVRGLFNIGALKTVA